MIHAASGALLRNVIDENDSAYELEISLANTGDFPIVRWKFHMAFPEDLAHAVRVHNVGGAGSGVRIDRLKTPGGFMIEPRHPVTFRSVDIEPGQAHSIQVMVLGPPLAPRMASFVAKGGDGHVWSSRVDVMAVADALGHVHAADDTTWPGWSAMDRLLAYDDSAALSMDHWWPAVPEEGEPHAVADSTG